MRTVNIEGFTFQVDPEPSDYWDWIESGHYASDLANIRRFAGPNVTCIDAGAWVGAYTLYASRIYRHVFAIEPDPVAFDMLMRNLNANTLTNVCVYRGALSDHIGTTRIGGAMLGCSCTRETCHENSTEVDCMTLRQFCKNIPDPLFIKMDVEGAEAQILTDWQFFAERKPDLMLSTHREWWREGGSNGKSEYDTITRVGKLYRKALHDDGKTPVCFKDQYGDVVFTDK